jgi:phosphatidate cytidylyltransferase
VTNAVSRVVVAAAALPLVLGAVYAGGWWLFALVTLGALVALHEFWLLTRKLSPLSPAGYVGAVLALVGAELGGVTWMLGGILTAFPLAFLLKGISASRQAPTASISATVMGALWVGGGLGFVLLVRDLHRGRLATLAVLIAVWAGDTLAYLGGRLIGRHRMAPHTSPGKTWEGFVFGTIATIFAAFVTLYDSRDTYLSIGEAVALGAVIAVAAPLGDLFESMLKRASAVKDSSSLIPGHGGVLDRIDALLLAAPVYVAVLKYGPWRTA